METPIISQVGIHTVETKKLWPTDMLEENGPITVRNLTDTSDDCQFAGRLTVEAFSDKFVHATSERR